MSISFSFFVLFVFLTIVPCRLKQQAGDLFLLHPTTARVRKRDILRRKVFGTDDNSGANISLPPPPTDPGKGKKVPEKGEGGVISGGGGRDGDEGDVLSPGIVDALFALLDLDGDGRLDQNEFMTLMKRQSAVPDQVSCESPVSQSHVSFSFFR